MKTLFALVLVLGAFAVNAQAACTSGETHYWPSNNPALHTGEGGAQDVLWTCVNGKFVENGYTAPAVKHRGCVEGEVNYWPSNNPALRNGESGAGQNVAWTCTGGRYIENGYTAPAPQYRGCTEGEISYGTEMSSTSGEYVNVTLVCHHGKFKRCNR
ncbi:MAG: hypothetical protein ACXWQO_03340 [Bdellovibrionota bacterium]